MIFSQSFHFFKFPQLILCRLGIGFFKQVNYIFHFYFASIAGCPKYYGRFGFRAIMRGGRSPLLMAIIGLVSFHGLYSRKARGMSFGMIRRFFR